MLRAGEKGKHLGQATQFLSLGNTALFTETAAEATVPPVLRFVRGPGQVPP